jgi:hypothetical protein
MNFGHFSSFIRTFLTDGEMDGYDSPFIKIFRDKDYVPETPPPVRILLFDAIDSGLSVDAVAEVSQAFDLILEDAGKLGMETYIIAAANEYELARNRPCFDVNGGKYIDLPDYEAYRSFVIKSRNRKEKRLDQQEVWRAKQDRKELAEMGKDRARLEERLAAEKEKGASKYSIDRLEYSVQKMDKQIHALRERIAQDILSGSLPGEPPEGAACEKE